MGGALERGPAAWQHRGGRARRGSIAGAALLGTLYIVGTPIGNLEDLSLRAARILRQTPLVAAEDTRTARKLLHHLGARPRLLSFHEHSPPERLARLLAALQEQDVALVCEAGMPGVSDPGRALVTAAAEQGIPAEVIPGPSAVTAALALSGMPADAFRFLGFLPRRRPERRQRWRQAAADPSTLVAFEAPHRLRACLEDLAEAMDARPIAVCRELTKLHQEVFRGDARQALDYFANPRGEFVLVVAGANAANAPGGSARPAGDTPISSMPDGDRPPDADSDDAAIARHLAGLRAAGLRAKDAAAQTAARYGISKNHAYRLWLAQMKS